MDQDIAFELTEARQEGEAELVVEVGGYEGPLDLLLDLARRQKVDLHEVSILALAEQYLAFVERARSLRLELAADYLVMAAWLAFLKSRLLLPEPPRPEGEATAGELAGALALRLRRLAAIRRAADRLDARERLGRDVFARGLRDAESPAEAPRAFVATLHDLLAAYGRQRQKAMRVQVSVGGRRVWSLAEARAALERMLGAAAGWVEIDRHLLAYLAEPGMRATLLASTLSAALELAREGKAVLRQEAPFAPVAIRGRRPDLRIVG